MKIKASVLVLVVYCVCIANSVIEMATVGGIVDSDGSQNALEIENLARYAVDEHNKKQNTMLVFNGVVKTREQVVAGTIYYITLEATDGGKKKKYEAKIWVKPWLNFKEVQEFKPVGDEPATASA
ncbi:hypothetical protein PVL29_007878 [Vitis rotundifolia]|uniref:Cysteine proteinase inhibitor n=1 Tax=Vitis rotundifolia TaxID=103349 RepID=A0AA39DXF1_VITRO|nr:hypothetical protein PVL29_007878 [Vitis rotundifolia]